MLYELFQWLEDCCNIPGAGLFQYITFRAGMAVVISLLISMVYGGRIVRYLKHLQIGETVRDLGLDGQKQKEGTPTMGGLIIIMAILIPCLLMADLRNVYIILMLLATTLMGLIGFLDDYIKVFRKNKEGLSGIFKIIGQVAFGLIIALTMLFSQDIVVRMDLKQAQEKGYRIVKAVNLEGTSGDVLEYAYVKTTLTNVPFFKGNNFDYKSLVRFLGDNVDVWAYIVFVLIVIFIVTAVSNAANLTDGLDGLATGVSGIIGVTLAIFAYVSGNSIAADYLNILFLPGSSELVIFSACFLGACIGFLWYNSYPAQIFMGDTGSLTLGGIIAAMAILLRKELLIPLMCGIFVVENISVVLQVSYFKYTKRKTGEGKRIYLMAPLHHHYQKKGLPETKIVTRFWIVGILLAVVTILTLKIR
ncbi:MAG: phospho-N-acetylmuramoyl-pentapeptide-transferase [Lewinellaceae bacterium]|nr:phospho-N-acetylmuramoyl-pentapeptide-transferase [Lewinellaceae bacterium]